MSTTHLDGAPRKKKKKSSTGSRKGHKKVTSHSRGSVGSTKSLNDRTKRKSSKDKRNNHSRYATAHPQLSTSNNVNQNNYVNNNNGYNNNGYNNNGYNNNGYNNNYQPMNQNMNQNMNQTININMSQNGHESRPKKKKKKRKKRINKIKSQNREHRKAATTNNALNTQKASNGYSSSTHKSSVTTPNALSVTSQTRTKRSTSNPRQFRHKFNMTEMQLVIGQIGEMKKSWKTPAEEVMGRIYEIIDMDERPHLNGKHCKVMLVLDAENYRVSLLGNSSEHVVEKTNLKVAFETENLYLLWESQNKAPKKRSTFAKNADGEPKPPRNKPPHQDPDDMYTIQAFEHQFEETYEFRRYDFYCMSCCILLGIICSGLGIVLFTRNEQGKDLYALGAFSIIFAPIIGVLLGVYIGCLWYCCAVGQGKMDRYLGKNRFFGFECKSCNFCKYQYFLVVALIGILIIIISITSYLLFDQYIENDAANHENNTLNINEQQYFLIIEILTGIGGVGLFIFGIIIYYCCINRKVDTIKGPSIHDDNFED